MLTRRKMFMIDSLLRVALVGGLVMVMVMIMIMITVAAVCKAV